MYIVLPQLEVLSVYTGPVLGYNWIVELAIVSRCGRIQSI